MNYGILTSVDTKNSSSLGTKKKMPCELRVHEREREREREI